MPEYEALSTWSVAQLSAQIARRQSALGGGVAAAVTGSLAAALLEKVARVEERRAAPAHRMTLQEIADVSATIRQRLLEILERDAQALSGLLRVLRRNTGQPDVLAEAAQDAIAPPLSVIEASLNILELGQRLATLSSAFTQSDVHASLALAQASYEAARVMVEANLPLLDAQSATAISDRLSTLDRQFRTLTDSHDRHVRNEPRQG